MLQIVELLDRWFTERVVTSIEPGHAGSAASAQLAARLNHLSWYPWSWQWFHPNSKDKSVLHSQQSNGEILQVSMSPFNREIFTSVCPGSISPLVTPCGVGVFSLTDICPSVWQYFFHVSLISRPTIKNESLSCHLSVQLNYEHMCFASLNRCNMWSLEHSCDVFKPSINRSVICPGVGFHFIGVLLSIRMFGCNVTRDISAITFLVLLQNQFQGNWNLFYILQSAFSTFSKHSRNKYIKCWPHCSMCRNYQLLQRMCGILT